MAPLLALLPGCIVVVGAPGGGADGPLVEEQRLVSPFEAVANDSRMAVTVVEGAAVDVRVLCPENLVHQVYTDVLGSVLRIDNAALSLSLDSWDTCAVTIVTPRLEEVTGSSSGTTSASGGWPELDHAAVYGDGALIIDGAALAIGEITSTGAGLLDVSGLDAAQTAIRADGLGGVVVRGAADMVEVTVTALGPVDALDLEAVNATLANHGSADLSAFVTDYAVVTLTGAGDVRIAGGGDVEIHDSGLGNVVVY